jgi:GT2 family glycosyltransferase
MRVSFVIPVKNDAAALSRCLASVKRASTAVVSEGIETEIVVIDNGSTDGSADVAREVGARVMVLPDLKVSELRNRGMMVSDGDFVAFVDADQEIAVDWLVAGSDSVKQRRVGAVGTLCIAPPNPTWVQRLYDTLRGHKHGLQEVEWLGSGNLLVRRTAFIEVGGFDTDLETCEDVDLCNRLRSVGWRILNDPRLRSIHYGDPSTLWQLFRGELWRGRDNMKVTLRGPWSVRSLPSLILPMLCLGGLICAAGGLTLLPLGWGWLGISGLLVVLGAASLRSLVIIKWSQNYSPAVIAQAYVIALVYETARALALVLRTGYRHRRTTAQSVEARV